MRKEVKVAVALSGGVDSAVAAALLVEQGYEVIGVFMKNWSDIRWGTCRPDRERKDALQVALKLKIPFKVFDFEKQYRQEVIEYFFAEYAAGRTPNPDVMCNKKIKFGLFLQRALKELGVDLIATGHYARVVLTPTGVAASGLPRSSLRNPGARYRSRHPSRFAPADRSAAELSVFHLLKGVDKNKDQSYFLWTLGQKELSRTLFPVGEMTKEQVRAKAAELGLPVAKKPDSQGICFVGEVDLRDFLKSRLGERPGKIVDVNGKVLGEHLGAHFFTVGQRHGLGIGGGIPYYVVRTDVKRNEVVVAPINHPAHFSKEMVVSDVNWIAGRPPKLPLKVGVKIRYRQPDVGAMLVPIPRSDRSHRLNLLARLRARAVSSTFWGPLPQKSASTSPAPGARSYLSKPAAALPPTSAPGARGGASLLVKFEEPQRAVTPGQSAVFYQGEELLGGGIIVGKPY